MKNREKKNIICFKKVSAEILSQYPSPDFV